MRYIETLHEGETIRNTYLCKGKRSAETRNGKPYDNLILQDKTGTLDGKIWDPNSNGIADYSEKDFIEVYGEIISYNGNLQMNIKQLRYRFVKNQKIAYFFGGWCLFVTLICCIMGMYNKDPFTFAMNVITPVVLTALGIIMPKLAERERAKESGK